jgi:hypothetical protein
MRRDTVRSEMRIPSLSNSPWTRGAPHPRFSVAIMRTRSRICLEIGGRPGPRWLDLHRQKRRKPRRCQRTTVSGRTITKTSAQCAQTDESQAQKTLSAILRRSRLCLTRRRTTSCWRRARISRARSLRVRTSEPSDATAATIMESTTGFCVRLRGLLPRTVVPTSATGCDSGEAQVAAALDRGRVSPSGPCRRCGATLSSRPGPAYGRWCRCLRSPSRPCAG